MDFVAYTDENEIFLWVEMDTVIGRIGSKVILTLNFTFCNFMAGLLLKNRSSAETLSKIIVLKNEFEKSKISFGVVFLLLPTDNGGEFADDFTIENDLNSVKESPTFFCDPFKSY